MRRQFSINHPLYLGDLNLTSLQTREMLKGVDVLVAIGAPLFRQPLFFPEPFLTSRTKLIQIDNDSWEIGKNFPAAAGIEGDIRQSLTELNEGSGRTYPPRPERLRRPGGSKIAGEKEKMTEAFLAKARKEKDNVPIAVSRLMQEVSDALKPGTLVIDDCWSCSSILRRSIDFKEPRSYQRVRDGSIGWGMPGALGAKLAAPDRPVVAVVGDGSAMWSIQSLWTAAHYQIPVTFVVCANAGYCQVKLMKTLRWAKRPGADIWARKWTTRESIFCNWLKGWEFTARRWSAPSSWGRLLRWAMGLGKPAVVEVCIEKVI